MLLESPVVPAPVVVVVLVPVPVVVVVPVPVSVVVVVLVPVSVVVVVLVPVSVPVVVLVVVVVLVPVSVPVVVLVFVSVLVGAKVSVESVDVSQVVFQLLSPETVYEALCESYESDESVHPVSVVLSPVLGPAQDVSATPSVSPRVASKPGRMVPQYAWQKGQVVVSSNT